MLDHTTKMQPLFSDEVIIEMMKTIQFLSEQVQYLDEDSTERFEYLNRTLSITEILANTFAAGISHPKFMTMIGEK